MTQENTTGNTTSRRTALKMGATVAGGLILGTAVAGQTAAQNKPFTGDFEGQAGIADEGLGCNATGDQICTNPVMATGQFSHLGRTMAEGTVMSDWSVYTASDRCAAVTGDLTLTAANGDSVTIELEGEQCEVRNNDGYTGTNELTAEYTITGGTGRFTDSEGSGDFTATANTATGAFTGTVDGQIDYDASNRRNQ